MTTMAVQGNGMLFRVLKYKYCQPGLLYPAKLSFKNKGEIKKFQEKIRQFVTRGGNPYFKKTDGL